jgi:hypothetical protein
MFQFIFYKLLFPPRPQALIPALGSYHSQPMLASQPSSSAPVSIHRVPRNRITPNWDFQRSVVSIAILLGFISFVAAEPLDPPQQDTRAERLGQTFAWICCAFYLTSRLPQILENHKRKSTRGIHIALFMAALCGNTCYTVGITTNPLAHDPSQRAEFLYNALPYLLGSAGYVHNKGKTHCRTIVFDITILFQYFRYRGQDPSEIDREAIRRYLTTDESWVQHRWSAFRKKLQFPFSISFHDGPYRHEGVLEGVEADDTDEAPPVRKNDETSSLLVKSGSRSYGTQ